MEGSKQIQKSASPSLNITQNNGILPGLSGLCYRLLLVYSIKVFKESDMKKAHPNSEGYSLKRVIVTNAINAEF